MFLLRQSLIAPAGLAICALGDRYLPLCLLHSSNRKDKKEKSNRIVRLTGARKQRSSLSPQLNTRTEKISMWCWLAKKKLGQMFNSEGIMSSMVMLIFGDGRNLAIPHLVVPDIRWVDWAELKRMGFRGVVFDKDNTLTAPYSSTVWPPLLPSLEECKLVFHDKVAVFSNSAGLCQYDPDGLEAKALEELIGIHVIRHGTKKPAGTSKDIETYFGCAASLLVMVGDRHFTDIVYGNRNGFLTILTEPLSLSQEPFTVKQVRKLEGHLVNWWYKKGLKASSHGLVQLGNYQCVVKEPTA